MLIHPTLDHMRTLKLFGMARALETQFELKEARELSFEERLGLLLDAEMVARENKTLETRLKSAKLRLTASLEDLELRATRGLDRSVITALGTCDWVQSKQNVLITGPTGAGKTYLSCALAQKACRLGFSVAYFRAPILFQDLSISKADGRYRGLLTSITKRRLIVLDDFALSPLTDEQRRDLLEILEHRYESSSTIIASQLPLDNWHDVIGDPTIADAILDRLIHNAHSLNLKGESMRKKKTDKNG
jgi:DNA replication protein DnaC